MKHKYGPRFTAKQREAIGVISTHDHVLCFGGSRSGKTFMIISILVSRAIRFPGSRHLIARFRFNAAKVSIWLDTLAKVLGSLPSQIYRRNESDHFVRFSNGSEIWVDGLDDKDRVEKILGREYNTIFFNEVSQLPYDSILMALTRLSLSVKGCRNYALYDCNPTGRGHWAFKVFIQKLDPQTSLALANPESYEAIRMNPIDNSQNLADGYIEKTLENLPPSKRARFLLGEWTDAEGVIFKNWDVIDEIPEAVKTRRDPVFGLDFGFSVDPAALIEIYTMGEDIWLDERLYQTDLINDELYTLCREAVPGRSYVTADSAEPKTIEAFYRKGLNIKEAKKGPDSVRYGIEWLKGKRIHITRRSVNLQNEFSSYCYKTDRNGKSLPEPIDDFNHGIDAIRYGCEEFMRSPGLSIPNVNPGQLGL